MTRADSDLLRGWQAAAKGQPFEPYESLEWIEGFLLQLKSKRRAA